MGRVPNLMKAMANSPAVLEGYLGFSGALAHGTLDPKLRERIAIATAESNGCGYCLAAHSLLGKLAGLDEDERLANRRGHSHDARADAALKFARTLLESGAASAKPTSRRSRPRASAIVRSPRSSPTSPSTS